MKTEQTYELDGAGLRWPTCRAWVDKHPEEPREIKPEQVEVCKRFLAACTPTKKTGISSYGLKHTIERWAGQYIGNGACIRAALDLGIFVEPCFTGYSIFSTGRFHGTYPINAYISVSRKSVAKNQKRRVPHDHGSI